MIKIEIYKDKNDIIWRYKIKGHANYDEYGKDIVCSAISILSQNTLMSLVEVVGINKSEIKYEVGDSGFIDVELLTMLDEEKLEKSQILLKSLELGIKSIIDGYKEYVTLKYREV